jgi:PhnB protein
MSETPLPRITPMLTIRGAAEAIDWYRQALGAEELLRLTGPGGTVVHADLRIAGGLVMLSEENPAFNASPAMLTGTSVVLNLLVEDADALWTRALSAGAKIVFPLNDQFYGYRAGRIEDPFGHQWIISRFLENVPQAEMQRRFDEVMKGG